MTRFALSPRARTIGLVALVAVLAAAAGAWWWFSTRAVSGVALAAVTRGPLATTVTGVADIEARDRTELTLSPTARVESVRVTEGQRVSQGDILVVLDTTELQGQLEQQLISLSDAQATLDYLAGAAARGSAATARQAVDQASLGLEGARAALAAARANQASVDASTDHAVQQADLARQSATTARDAAARAVDVARSLGDGEVARAKLALDDARTARRLAATNIEALERQLRDGTITRAQYDAQWPALHAALETAGNAVHAAEAALDDARTLADSRVADAETSWTDADTAVRVAEVGLDDARTQADAQRAAASRAVGDAERAVRSAEVTLTGARGAAGVSGSTDAERVSNQASQVELLGAQIRALEDLIGQAHLRSAVDGVVTRVDAVPDTYPQAGDRVVVEGSDQLVAVLPVDQADSAGVRTGQRSTVTLRGLARDYAGVVSSIAPVASVEPTSTDTDPQVEVTIALTDPDADVRIGFDADAEVVLDERSAALQVAREAVQTDPVGGRPYVWVVDHDGRVARTWVETGISSLDVVEIRSGLSEGQRCVLNPDAGMRDGVRVRDA